MDSGKVCVVCNQMNPPGTKECLKCTAPLRVSATVLLSGQVRQQISQQSQITQGEMAPGTIGLHFVGRKKPLVIPIDDTLILGRDAGDGVANLVDLTRYRAGLLGVSRQHAAIHAGDNGYVIEDLNSTNGTWVNETPLKPETPFALANGDNIRLGELIIYLYFKLA